MTSTPKRGSMNRTIRRKNKRLTSEADSGCNPRAAIHLFCMECVGNCAAEVEACSSTQCFLWKYRSDTADVLSETDPFIDEALTGLLGDLC